MAIQEVDSAAPDQAQVLEPLERPVDGARRRTLRDQWIHWLDRPAVPGVLALLGMLGYVLTRLERWSHGRIGDWILVGSRFATSGQVPAGVGVRQNSYGYDGQFYYRLALDPANLHQTAYGITLDAPYRLMRIGYPVITWLASLGQGSFVPTMLVVVNVAAVAALGVLGGAFARLGGHHALWGLLLPCYFGLLTSVGRDTAEPVACAFLLGGLLALRRRRPVLAGALLAVGALTRETVMVAAAAIALVRVVGWLRLRRVRLGREDVAWLLPGVVFVAWEVVVKAVTGTIPLDADDGRNAGTPFIAVYDAIRTNVANLSWSQFTWTDIWLLEFSVLAAVAFLALASLRWSRVPSYERVALVGFLIEICVVSPFTWDSLNADLRSFVEVYLLAVMVLLGVPRARYVRPAAWLLPVASAWAAPALLVVGGRRVFWS